MKNALWVLFLAACTSAPYVEKTQVDRLAGKKTETVCTHKRAFIPWVLPGFAGFTTTRYGKTCTERTTTLVSP